ncbi:MAG: site-2 protease family protein [Candidatus Hydrogenedentes bacterium]|nr:site-2 protease family protein [Candidatus Hydrogenedentota bacterium]
MDIDVGQIVLQYFVLLFSLCFHEAAHAWMSNRCGDPSARLLGRLTLDPRKHIDLLGTVVMPLAMMILPQIQGGASGYMFGWAKPVPFNPRNLNNARRDPVLIAIAGPVSNLLIAIIATLSLRIVVILARMDESGAYLEGLSIASQVIEALIYINLLLMLFNIIPIPPLDGHYALKYFLPPAAEEQFERIGPMGLIITMLFIAPIWVGLTLPILVSIVRFAAGLSGGN